MRTVFFIMIIFILGSCNDNITEDLRLISSKQDDSCKMTYEIEGFEKDPVFYKLYYFDEADNKNNEYESIDYENLSDLPDKLPFDFDFTLCSYNQKDEKRIRISSQEFFTTDNNSLLVLLIFDNDLFNFKK